MTYLIIGNGRTARHMTHYLWLLGHQTKHWHYRESNQTPLESLVSQCDRTLLLIKDSAIESFLRDFPFLRSSKTVHFSGAIDVLGIGNVHPLISFSHELFNLEFYQQIPFAIFTDEAANLEHLLPGLNNPSFVLPKKSKGLYHGLCVASGNLTVLLWQLVGQVFKDQLNVPHERLIPYLESIAQNLKTHWAKALTGPIARRDEITLSKNSEALRETPLNDIFEAHVRTAWPEFAEKHFPQKSQEMRSL